MEKVSVNSLNEVFTPYIFITKNGGNTWRKSITDSIQGLNLLLNGQLLNENIGFICGGFGFEPALMLRTTNGGVLFVDNNQENIVSQYKLSHTYPNPFNPSTTIQFSLPQASYVTLKIYNLLGEGVETLVSEQLSAGMSTRTWKAEKFASGVYYYRLQTGRFIETKKLLFIR